MIQVGSGYSKTNASEPRINKKNPTIQSPHIEGVAPGSSLRRFLSQLDQRFFQRSSGIHRLVPNTHLRESSTGL